MLPLSEEYPDMVLDQRVSGGCSSRRPDGLIDCYTHSVIIEIDEDQHASYDSVCDNRRTMELFNDLGSRPLIFIRLNPDSYKIDGKRIKSVFAIDKSGEMTMNKKEFAYRLEVLQDAVRVACNTRPNRDLSYVKLFYTDE